MCITLNSLPQSRPGPITKVLIFSFTEWPENADYDWKLQNREPEEKHWWCQNETWHTNYGM